MENRRRASVPWVLVTLVVLVCMALAYAGAALGRRMFAGEELGSHVAVEIANLQKLQATADGFVYYDGSRVTSIDSSGRARWSYQLGADAGFSATDYGVAAWAGSAITLINAHSGATSFNGNMEADVISAHIGDKYTAVLIGEETNGTMVVMESGGRQVSQIVFEDVTVIDYGFFSDGALLWVMICDSNGTVPTCNIQTYRPGKEIVGSIHDNEQMAYAVMFQQSQVLVAGNTYLRSYDYTGTEDASQRRLIYGWYLASADESSSDPLMAFVNDAQTQGESDIRDVRMMRSNVDRIVRLPYGCMSVVARGNSVYAFSSDGHMVIASLDQDAPSAYKLDLSIDAVYGVTQDGHAVLGNGGMVYLVNLA